MGKKSSFGCCFIVTIVLLVLFALGGVALFFLMRGNNSEPEPEMQVAAPKRNRARRDTMTNASSAGEPKVGIHRPETDDNSSCPTETEASSLNNVGERKLNTDSQGNKYETVVKKRSIFNPKRWMPFVGKKTTEEIQVDSRDPTCAYKKRSRWNPKRWVGKKIVRKSEKEMGIVPANAAPVPVSSEDKKPEPKKPGKCKKFFKSLKFWDNKKDKQQPPQDSRRRLVRAEMGL